MDPLLWEAKRIGRRNVRVWLSTPAISDELLDGKRQLAGKWLPRGHIYVNANYSIRTQDRTYVHELFHECMDQCPIGVSLVLEERLAFGLELPLTKVFGIVPPPRPKGWERLREEK